MSSVLLILLGILMVWMALTEKSSDIWKAFAEGNASSGYNSMSLGRFLIGAAIVSLPLFVIERDDWKWSYIAMILLGFLAFNNKGLYRFSAYIRGALIK